MGSINCKEYKTTNNPACAQDNGDTGSYKFRPEGDMEDYVEAVVCNDSDIQENEMKQVEFDSETKILLIKQNGRLKAIGNKCSHYGALLHTGALGEGRVRCPWHGACFNIENGDIEDFPGLDSVPCYNVSVQKDGKVKVRAPKSEIEKDKRLKNMVNRIATDERVFVIIGGGPSAEICVETLRQEGYTGRIVMLCKENTQPYDRVKLSKAFDAAIASVQYRSMEFYNEYSIEPMLGVAATKLDTDAKTVTCSNGYVIKFDKLYIATGSQATKAPLPGADLKNVFTIRDHTDAVAINAQITKESKVVCVGSSFIALEAAASLVTKVKSVTVVGREDVPLKNTFGAEVGQRVLQLFRDKGINMVMSSGIKEILGANDTVSEVVLVDDNKLACDVCIMGTGTRLYTDFLQDSGIQINPNGSIDTDQYLMTNIPDIYAGGDIANAPVFTLGNQRATIGHYQLAQYHGRIAAFNMAGKVKELRAVPFFWTMLFGKGFRWSGYGDYTEVKVVGDMAELKFVAFYMDGEGNVIAVGSCGRDPVVAQYAEYLTLGKRLHKRDLEGDDPLFWTQNLRSDTKVC